MAKEEKNTDPRQDVVDFLLKKSQEKDREPQPNNADVDQKAVADILKRIQKGIQERKS